MEVSEAKSRLLEWAHASDKATPAIPFNLAPALGSAAAGLLLGRLLPGGKRSGRGSLVGGALSLATIIRLAKWGLPLLLNKKF